MDKTKLLQAVYKVLPWDLLYEELPELDRGEVDDLFREMSDLLARRKDRAAPPAPADVDVSGGEIVLHTDGASRGNPGPAGIGVVLSLPDGTELLAWGQAIGTTTNNVAEYQAMIAGLRKALELGATAVHLRADSELVIRQVNGRYKVKNARMKPLHAQVMELLGKLREWDAVHIPREQNARADELAGGAVKNGG